jgi:DNA-directed RNA polymerase specialized sigma24 family protein
VVAGKLCAVYTKSIKNLLKLAMVLLNDVSDAEDIVHDVFVSFAKSVEKLKLNGSLKSYLSTCVANRPCLVCSRYLCKIPAAS